QVEPTTHSTCAITRSPRPSSLRRPACSIDALSGMADNNAIWPRENALSLMTHEEAPWRLARMRMYVYLVALLFLAGSGALEILLTAQSPDPGKQTKRARPLRIAIVQMKSLDHDIDGNLKQATA